MKQDHPITRDSPSYDPRRCLSLGPKPFSFACTLCSSRAAPPGAGLPSIGILSDTSRKNGWQLAEHAREAHPDGMQRLLSSAVWDTDGVRDEPLAPTLLP